jgi:IS30 family transposase
MKQRPRIHYTKSQKSLMWERWRQGDSQVSHETIYRSLYIQARGALKKELLAHLRRNACHATFAPSHLKDRRSRQNCRRRIDQ